MINLSHDVARKAVAKNTCNLYLCTSVVDSTDAIFTVTSSGAAAGRIGLTGDVDRETRDTYTISIEVCKMENNYLRKGITSSGSGS